MIIKSCHEKTYPLAQEGKHTDRVIDAIKYDIRQYIKRESIRPTPSGVDFDCRVGGSRGYVEFSANHGLRKARSAEQG